jgi:hypothetical protein
MSRHRRWFLAQLICGVLVLEAAAACGKSSPTAPTPTTGSGTVPPATSGSSSPSARRHSGITYDASRQRVLLYGGVDNFNVALDDLWSWNGTAWTMLAARSGGSGTGTELYATATDVFSVSTAGRVQRLSDTQWVPLNNATTPVREAAAYAYDSARGRLIRYGGGASPGQAALETWEFDGGSWTLVSSQGPPQRFLPAMAYDPQRRVTVLFGGLSASADQKLNDTWEWNGRDWTQVSAPAPSGRFGATMVFDGGAGEMLVYGGIDTSGAQISELWRRTNGAWTSASSSGPPPRAVALMAFDAARRNVVMFGGDGGQLSYGDTWTWDGRGWMRRDE